MNDPYPPISDYALLSDCHSAALVSRDGSVDWCCFHRFDARPVFARILDWNKGGHFRIAPKSGYSVSRRYLPGTNILETTFETSTGRLVLTDLLPITKEEAPDGDHAFHQLLRFVRCESGSVEGVFEFKPRFDYGLTTPRIEPTSKHEALVFGGPDGLLLQSSFDIQEIGVGECSGGFSFKASEEGLISITYELPQELESRPLDPNEARARLQETKDYWEEWSSRCKYDGPYKEHVLRSALVLKGLQNGPTGAIVAAPTTSLPETIGGPRNWDYRFAWLRDSALNLYALFFLGFTDEAHAFMAWLKRTSAGVARDLQTLYGVGGERLVPEFELAHLEGYRGSKPVRIGNAAMSQLQLDIYGELLDTAWLYHRHGGEIDAAFWSFCRDVIDVVEELWDKPDEGIWEVRGGPLQFTSSKVFCWVAVDRAIKLARDLKLEADLPRWKKLRKSIREKIEKQGFDPEQGMFRRSFGQSAPDASNLLIPLVRFLKGNDERVIQNMDATLDKLTKDGLVYRYLREDGLPTQEGAFLICSFWLVSNLAGAGRKEEATELFERLIGYCNDVGLLAEEIDPATGEQLGNFPQAFSHVGLIGAAINLIKTEPGAST
jgi:GH15 family glucan-1,4-alpha-glucosidase